MGIRTPDDEITKPGYLYPPFAPGRTYQGITYAGHSDYAVDWNRRTPAGGWLDDRGDPVHAAAAGTVKETTPVDGYVLIAHPGGYATEYRHMQPVLVKPGDKVQRGDIIGRIGEAGNAPNGTHLHMRAYKDGKPIKLRLEGQNIPTSVGDSDSRPKGWQPPAPVYVQGPPPRATWESAYKESEKAREKAEERVDGLGLQLRAAADELKAVKADLAAEKAKVATYEVRVSGYIEERTFLSEALKKATAERDAARAELETCMSRPTDAALAAERDGALERARQEMERANAEADRAVEAETKVREAVAVLTR